MGNVLEPVLKEDTILVTITAKAPEWSDSGFMEVPVNSALDYTAIVDKGTYEPSTCTFTVPIVL